MLAATGQDPSKFSIPTINSAVAPNKLQPTVNDDLKLLSNLLASPSPLNEPFDSLTQKPSTIQSRTRVQTTTPRPRVSNAATATIKNDLKNLQEDPKFLQSLIQLQGKQETTTQKNKLAISGNYLNVYY